MSDIIALAMMFIAIALVFVPLMVLWAKMNKRQTFHQEQRYNKYFERHNLLR